MRFILSIALFGMTGVLARYLIEVVAARALPLPVATFFINIGGSFLAGLIYALGFHRGAISDLTRMGLLVGFCGGFTTFSAYGLQTLLLVEKGQPWHALLYWGLSPVLGLLAAYLGMVLGR